MAESSEDRDERQLPASEQKLRKAREEGQVPRSREAGHAASLIALIMTVAMYGPAFATRTLSWIRESLRFGPTMVREPEPALIHASRIASEAFSSLLPVLAVPTIASAASGLAIGGLVWTVKPTMPDLARLDPLAGLVRLFSLESLLNVLKVVLLAGLIGVVGAGQLAEMFEHVAGYPAMALPAALDHARKDVRTGLLPVLSVVIAIAIIDGPLQVFMFRRRMRMTRQEAKEEFREAEGDPLLKGKIRAKQRALAQGRMLSAVPAADVVVTNPTHFAVALKYQDGLMSAPRVVAKGADLWAARIREIASQHDVPILEAPPLARALYRHVEIDQEIPAALYAAVAQVLAWVYQLTLFRSGRGVLPREPVVEVPDELDPREAQA